MLKIRPLIFKEKNAQNLERKIFLFFFSSQLYPRKNFVLKVFSTFSFDIRLGCVFDTLTDLITPKLPTKLRSNFTPVCGTVVESNATINIYSKTRLIGPKSFNAKIDGSDIFGWIKKQEQFEYSEYCIFLVFRKIFQIDMVSKIGFKENFSNLL